MHCHVFFLDRKEIMKNGVGAFMRQASKNYSAVSSEEKDELAKAAASRSFIRRYAACRLIIIHYL